MSDFEGIKQATHLFYKDLYSETVVGPIDSTAYPLSLIPSLVQEELNHSLTSPVTMKELRAAFDQMDPDKAPGPDGFTTRFFKACWPLINKNLHIMVLKSQTCAKIEGSTNSAFLALIPKEKEARNFDRFRPISLCNTGYKLVTKIIANRIKGILPRLIPENQGGFIQGRQIINNIILVQEVIHSSSP